MGIDKTPLSPEKEYQRQNPGAGGAASQQQRRDPDNNPKVTPDQGGAGIPGSQNEDVKGRDIDRRPKGAST